MKLLFHFLKKPFTVAGQIWLYFFVMTFIVLLASSIFGWANYDLIFQGSYSNLKYNGHFVYFSGFQWIVLLSLVVSVIAIVFIGFFYALILSITHVFRDFIPPRKYFRKNQHYDVLGRFLKNKGLTRVTAVTNYDTEIRRINPEVEVVIVDRIEELTFLGKIIMVSVRILVIFFLTLVALITLNPSLIWNGEFYKENDYWRQTDFGYNRSEFTNYEYYSYPTFLTKKEVKKFFSGRTRRKLYRRFEKNENYKYYSSVIILCWYLIEIGRLEGAWKEKYEILEKQAEQRRIEEAQ